MSTRARRITVAVAVAALALPAAAHGRAVVVAGPMKVQAYRLMLIGIDGRDDALNAVFARRQGRSMQQHHYLFTRGVEVTPGRIAGSLGRFGSVDLRLTGATRARGAAPPGCTGKPAAVRRGELTGSLQLVADATYFGTVTTASLRARTYRGGSLRCSGAGAPAEGGGGRGPGLQMTARDKGGATLFRATRRTQLVMRLEREKATAPATVIHLIAARRGGLHVHGRRAATVRGAAPWIAGRGIFEGRRLSGNLFAAFDSIGAVPLEGRAALRR